MLTCQGTPPQSVFSRFHISDRINMQKQETQLLQRNLTELHSTLWRVPLYLRTLWRHTNAVIIIIIIIMRE